MLVGRLAFPGQPDRINMTIARFPIPRGFQGVLQGTTGYALCWDFPVAFFPLWDPYALMPERATKIGSVSFFGLFQTELQHLPEIQQDLDC